MYKMLSGSSKVAARMSLDVMIELYRKNIWRDAKTVNVLATACLSPVTKIMGAALRFFLTEEEDGGEAESESSDESDTESRALRDMVLSRQTVKSGRKRERKVARARAVLKKQQKKRKGPAAGRFLALHLIHDPQDFAEKLFKRLERATEKFEIRLLMMALISRLTGIHQLFLFNLYPFLQRYLQPHQKEVTKVMTYLAQASHELVPPEVLEPVVKAVANNFITERNNRDAIAMGLNTVREVCVRCPLVMTQELLADLAGYKTYRDKGVVMAARSLIQLYRSVRPELLRRKDRGQPVEGGVQRAPEYGELVAEQHVPGMELVDIPSEPEEDVANDVSESDSEWIDVHHSSDEDSACEESNEHGELLTHSSSQSRRETKRGRKRRRDEEKRDGCGKDGDESNVSQQLKRQRVERAVAISQSRLLTDEEFHTVRLKQATAQLHPKSGHSKDSELLLALEEGRGPGEVLSEEAITTIHSKLRRTKEERLATAKASREKTYGHKRPKLNPHSSTTNQQKTKSKSFTMMRQKKAIRAKGKRSFRERQIKLRNSLLKQKK
jgi:protein SDA1